MASKKYVVWDKTSNVITPIGEVLSPEQWMDRYPVAGSLTTVCAGGDINGAFFGVLSQMVDMYEKQGADFSQCETDQDKLDVIEAFEDARNTPSPEASNETRIADALEDLVVIQETSEA